MKSLQHLLIAALLTLTISASAQTRPAPEGNAVTSGETRVIVPTAVSELAKGYADAIQQMALKTTVVYVKGDGKVVAIKGIRSARPMGSVLLITLSAGSLVAVNPLDVVMITDGASVP